MHHTIKPWGMRLLETYYPFSLHDLPHGMILQQSCATAVLGIFLSVIVIVNCALSMGLENKCRLIVKKNHKSPINIWCLTKARLQ